MSDLDTPSAAQVQHILGEDAPNLARAEAEQFFRALFTSDAVFELRALGAAPDWGTSTVTRSGFFNDPVRAAEEALAWSGRASGVYVTANPLAPELLALANNRSLVSMSGTSAKDADVERRRWLTFDVDPVRRSGIAATNEEHNAAIAVAKGAAKDLFAKGWGEPIVVYTGNGCQLLYPIDEPVQDGDLIAGVLRALDARYSTGRVKLDVSCSNAARLVRVPGTLNKKGDEVPGRPHRLVHALIPTQPREPVPHGLLEACAAEAPASGAGRPPSTTSQSAAKTPPAPPASDRRGLDVKRWASRHGLALEEPKVFTAADGRPATRWGLGQCRFSEEHRDGAHIIQFENGAITAGCHHDSCKGKGWEDLRVAVEGVEMVRPRGALKAETADLLQDSATKKLFEGKGKLKGPKSERGFDLALVRAAHDAGVEDRDELATLVSRRPCYLAAARSDNYLARVVHEALAPAPVSAAAADFAESIGGTCQHD